MKDFKCSKNLYRAAESYFSERTATSTVYATTVEGEVTTDANIGHARILGPEFCNIQYNSLLNLDFNKRTIGIALADSLTLPVSDETNSKAEDFTNMDTSKVVSRGKDNKRCFNEENSKVMVFPKMKKERERKY